jgi:hypothetical protein
MRRIHWITINLFTASAMLFAQDSQTNAPQNGGWRRAGDPAAPVASAPSTTSTASAQDQNQPVARMDAYGQPLPQVAQDQPAQPQDSQQAPPQPATQMQRNDRPPAAVPHYGLPASVTIKTGTFVNARVNQELNSDHSQVGDVFSATLTEPIVVDGVVVAQRGQTVMGRVTEAIKASKAQGTSHLGLQLTAINLADGTQAANQSHVVAGNSAAPNSSTTASPTGVLLTHSHPTILYPQMQLTFQLDTPVTVDLTRAPQAFRYVGPEDYNRGTQTTTTSTVRRTSPSVVYAGPGYYGYPYGYYGYGYGYPYYYGGGFGVGIRLGGGYRRFR